jgi:hypothetical protein
MGGISGFGAFAFIGLALLALPYISFAGFILVTILHFWIGLSWWWMTLPLVLGALGAWVFISA